MKPMMIVPPKTFSDEDLKMLRDNGLCVVECSEPARVKFVDPMPAVSSRTQIENAAIGLSRLLLNNSGPWRWNEDSVGKFSGMFTKLLIEGTPLDLAVVQTQRLNQQAFDDAKADELRKIAREEARAEREAKKAGKK
jgi:hypothetical protein